MAHNAISQYGTYFIVEINTLITPKRRIDERWPKLSGTL